jgi:hypothetical protein
VIENKFSENDFTQRSLIDTWLVEIYLNEINCADDNLCSKNLSENLKELLKLKEKYLDKVLLFIIRTLFINYYSIMEE